MFSGRAWLGHTGRRTYSTRETPARRDRELALKTKEGGTKKEAMSRNNGKEKSIL